MQSGAEISLRAEGNFGRQYTRALIRDVGESSSASIDTSGFASSSDNRALIGSSTGLADREISICGTVSFMALCCGSAMNAPSMSESRLRGSCCWKPSSAPTLSILLKYFKVSAERAPRKSIVRTLTVLTCSSEVASSSTTIIGCGCIWRLDSVHIWFTPPSMHLCKASALCAPVMMMTTSRA
jgi:hypothetical protein